MLFYLLWKTPQLILRSTVVMTTTIFTNFYEKYNTNISTIGIILILLRQIKVNIYEYNNCSIVNIGNTYVILSQCDIADGLGNVPYENSIIGINL